MTKSILTIGFELAAEDAQSESFVSKASLLDWDIILFKPLIDYFIDGREHYQGKPCLDENASFALKEYTEHWRREVKQAVDTGRTVIVFLPAIEEVFVDTGERNHSGTGRNQKTTRIVREYSNYECLPVRLQPINSEGAAMKLAPNDAEMLAPFWAEFGELANYRVILTAKDAPACVLTRGGDRTVGAIYRSKDSAGTLVLLPDIDFEADEFVDGHGEKQVFTAEAAQFARRMLNAIVALDKALRSTAEVTPEPAWAGSSDYSLGREQSLRSDLLGAEQKVEEAQKRLENLVEDLKSAGRPRALLFEKGKPLEAAIVSALQTLGFKASPYKDARSEFDVVFECAEGRLIGEAEGKDNKAINVDKLRQLAMNVHEDLARDEVQSPAKAVLFGNGFRLTPPAERKAAFTEKCICAAASSFTALVATTDLFVAVQYLSRQHDEDYAWRCREAVLKASGLVVFPPPAHLENASEALLARSESDPAAPHGALPNAPDATNATEQQVAIQGTNSGCASVRNR